MSTLRSIATLAMLSIAGCAVGPDYKRPDAPDVSRYTAAPLATTGSAKVAAGEAQRFANGTLINRR